jgi:hypothetical protein
MNRTDQDVQSRRAAGKTRRRFLLALGTTSAVAVAGCNSDTDTTATDTAPSEESTATDGEATGTPTSGGTDDSPGMAVLPREDQQSLQLATTTREQIQFSLASGGN